MTTETGEPMCQCPKCGRMHRDLQAGTPPKAIALPQSEIESAKIFGDDLEHWRIRVGALCRTVDTLEDEIIGLREELAGARAQATRVEDTLADNYRRANESLSNAYHIMRVALIEIAGVGDGFGARHCESGTTGEGHARCRAIADEALGIGFADLPSTVVDADAFWQDFRRESADANDGSEP